MATSDIDQKLLGRIARDVSISSPLLSAALYKVLGLSVMLSRKLYRARKLRRLDLTRDTKSVRLYHQIIWLSREGLAITETFVIPYCQTPPKLPYCKVMAAKLRASFYHLFCLFHNQPPISFLVTKSRKSDAKPPQSAERSHDTSTRTAVLREAVPSMASEASYITNPYALSGPPQTSPPPYPPPPVPQSLTPLSFTPQYPPRISVPSPVRRSPPSSADFILPPLNFVPATTVYFAQANALAREHLPGSNPLRLSIAYESCTFTLECAKDLILARDRARSAIKAVYTAPEGMGDNDFEDAATLVRAIALIAKQTDIETEMGTPSPIPQPTESEATEEKSPASRSEMKDAHAKQHTPRSRKPRYRKSHESNTPSIQHQTVPRSKLSKLGPSTVAPEATTSDTKEPSQEFNSDSLDMRSRASSTSHISDKERKRRRVEQAERALQRRRNRDE